jgi:hypothetical protein
VSDDPSKRTHFNPWALLGFVGVCVLFDTLISFQSPSLDRASAYLYLGLRITVAAAFVGYSIRRRFRPRTEAPSFLKKWFVD